MLTKCFYNYVLSPALSLCMILLAVGIGSANTLVYQGNTVTGTITSSEDNSALPGVNIVEKGTTNGTITDMDGKYSLKVGDNATLTISSVGYVSEDVPVNGRSVIDLSMSPDITALSEVVVIGYGEIRQKGFYGVGIAYQYR